MSHEITVLGACIGTAESINTDTASVYYKVTLNAVGVRLLGPDQLANVSLFTKMDPEKLPMLSLGLRLGTATVEFLDPIDSASGDSDDQEPLVMTWVPDWSLLLPHVRTKL